VPTCAVGNHNFGHRCGEFLRRQANRLSTLGGALVVLAAKMEPQAAAEIAKGLATALENPQETNSDRLSSLGKSLAAFCALLPSAHHTHLLNTHFAPRNDHFCRIVAARRGATYSRVNNDRGVIMD
jgi:hypothetical protein